MTGAAHPPALEGAGPTASLRGQRGPRPPRAQSRLQRETVRRVSCDRALSSHSPAWDVPPLAGALSAALWFLALNKFLLPRVWLLLLINSNRRSVEGPSAFQTVSQYPPGSSADTAARRRGRHASDACAVSASPQWGSECPSAFL